MQTLAVIPAYREASHVSDVVREVAKFVDQVVVVDDGSDDGTSENARKAGALVLTHAMNCGPGAATMTGIHAARRLGADIVVTIDADGQHNPADIPKILEPVRRGEADIVIGTRFRGPKNTIPLLRRVFNGMGNIITYITTGTYVSDSQSGFKAFGPEAIRSLHLHLSGFEFCTEIIREAAHHHWRVVEIPIRVTYSEYTLAKGQSFSRGVITACKILLRAFLR